MRSLTSICALAGALGLATFAVARLQEPQTDPTAAQEPGRTAFDSGTLGDAQQRLHAVAARVLWNGAEQLGVTVDKGALIVSSIGAGKLLIGAPVAGADAGPSDAEPKPSRPRGSDIGPPGTGRPAATPDAAARALGVDGRTIGVLVTTQGVVGSGVVSGLESGAGQGAAEVTESFRIVLRTSGSLELLDATGETVLVVAGVQAAPGAVGVPPTAGERPVDGVTAPQRDLAWGHVYGTILAGVSATRS